MIMTVACKFSCFQSNKFTSTCTSKDVASKKIKVYIISNSSFDVNIFRNAKLERKGASTCPVRWNAAQMAKIAFPMSAVDVKVKPVKMTCDVYWSK